MFPCLVSRIPMRCLTKPCLTMPCHAMPRCCVRALPALVNVAWRWVEATDRQTRRKRRRCMYFCISISVSLFPSFVVVAANEATEAAAESVMHLRICTHACTICIITIIHHHQSCGRDMAPTPMILASGHPPPATHSTRMALGDEGVRRK